jgi:hypothetical protein
VWTELKGCSEQVSFGKNGQLYRRSCNNYIYKWVDDDWEKISDKKAWRISAS